MNLKKRFSAGIMKMEDRLKEIILSLTNRCNLRCAMCQIPERGPAPEMSTAQVRALIADAAALCPGSIVFSGGEPLLREDLFTLIAFANQHKINTCLTSNGILIDDDVAGKLACAGMGVVNISVEGPPEVHDALRGRGTFEKARAAIENLSRHKIETTIANMVCRQNYKFMPYIMELARATGVTTVKFQPFSGIFLKDKNRAADFFIPAQELPDIERCVEAAIQLADKYKIAVNPPDYLRSLSRYLCGQRPKAAARAQRASHASHGCGALLSSCSVAADGNVYPCWVLADKALGNVTTRRLTQIWDSKDHDRLRRRIALKGCPGCLMSCYDGHLGKDPLRRTFTIEARRFRTPKFYKKLYFRLYQRGRYVARKIVRRLCEGAAKRPGTSQEDATVALRAIREAKRELRENMGKFKNG
jgi:MoaA/NifB/PqqE/SkfB family radical SAM enzyme